jgi:hypothetical protein
MIQTSLMAAPSHFGISVTIPELECDIDAQIRALLDPEHPKMCVFLAPGNSIGNRKLPSWIFVEKRPEGILLTDSASVAATFRTIEWITDDLLAAMLGYPETKADVIECGFGSVVQALDKDGNIVFEAAASRRRLDETKEAAQRQVPQGGSVHVTTPEAALARRFRGKMN